jgi:hypothetical protein
MLCSIWGRCSWLWLWCCVVDFRHVLWTITCIIYAFLCLVDNCNEICVIVMYKFSGGHAKNLCYFFASNNRFSTKVDRFSAKSGQDSVADFLWNLSDLLVSLADFSFHECSCSFHAQNDFRLNFTEFFQTFSKPTGSLGHEFFGPADFFNTGRDPHLRAGLDLSPLHLA